MLIGSIFAQCVMCAMSQDLIVDSFARRLMDLLGSIERQAFQSMPPCFILACMVAIPA
jgi:hypothetical protein